LVAYGAAVGLAEAMADRLVEEELDAGVVVPSLLAPFCRQTLLRVLGSRERVVVIEECAEGPGFGAELGTALLESGWRGRFARVASPPIPIPAARSLEEQVLPDEERIMRGVLRVLDLG
jgi:pyruvate/2-oxoglutarate/acetoin dehydrogenase E1 component